MYEYLLHWKDKTDFRYDDFLKIGKKMVAKIIFNSESVPDDIFNLLSEANSTQVFTNQNFKLNQTIHDNYTKILYHYINNPNPESLVALCLTVSDDRMFECLNCLTV